MLVFLGILILSGFFMTSIISYMVSKNTIRESMINNELPLVSDTIYSEIQRGFLQPVLCTSLMANAPVLLDWVQNGEQDLARIQKYLTEIKSKTNAVTSYFVSDQTMKYYHPSGILKTVRRDEPKDEWYFRVREMKDAYEINVDVDMANQDAITVFINTKVVDKNGTYLGASGMGLSVTRIKKLIDVYRNRYNRNIYFADAGGNIVLESSVKGDEKKYSHLDDVPGLSKLTTQILSGNLLDFEYRSNDGTVLLNVRYIPDLHWFLLVEQREDELTGVLQQTFLGNVLISLIISIIVLSIIRITIIRYQERLENHNQKLKQKNKQINEQRIQLKNQTVQLEKANENLALLNKEKDEFIGITAHDLKSPLNSVMGFAELIKKEGDVNEDTRQFSDYIVTSAQRMLEHINSLLDMSAAESIADIELESIDYRQPVRHAVNDFRYQAQAKGIEIRTSLPDEPVLVRVYEKWMVEIVGNLISNAIKFSPNNKKIQITLARLKDSVQLEVSDEGPGIPPEELSKLFLKHSQLTPQPTGGENSTGLGLYIVKTMTQRMGGSTRCESQPGEGSRFYLEFPAS